MKTLDQILSEVLLWQTDLTNINRAEKKEIDNCKKAFTIWLKQKRQENNPMSDWMWGEAIDELLKELETVEGKQSV